MKGDLFPSEEQDIISRVLMVTASLGVIGALFIIITYSLFKQTRTYGTTLLLFLSIADLFASLSWLPWSTTALLCEIQAASVQYFAVASFFWTTAIAHSLYQVFLRGRTDLRSLLKYMHLICWGLPIISVVLGVYLHKFGRTEGGWCWVHEPRDLFRLFVYVPLMIAILFNSIVFIVITCRVSSAELGKMRLRLTFYILAFVLAQLPGLANRLQNYVQPERPIFALYLLQGMTQPLQGFLNCIVYGFTEYEFMGHYRALFRKCCFCGLLQKSQQGGYDTLALDDSDSWQTINKSDKAKLLDESAPVSSLKETEEEYDYHSDEDEEAPKHRSMPFDLNAIHSALSMYDQTTTKL